MAVETPNQPKVSSLKFFNRTAKVNQENVVVAKDKLIQIDDSLKRILSIREKSIDVSRVEEEQAQRQQKEKKLEASKFSVKGVGKLANRIPGKNTIQKFLIFMAFGWLFNTFSKYFGQLSGPLSKIIVGSASVIDVFSKITFGIFDGLVTFIDIGYKTWDVIRGTGDSQKLQSAMNNVLLDVDSFFGGILSLLGIVERPPEEEVAPPQPAAPTPGGPGAPSPGAPPAPSYTGGILPSTKIGSRAGDRVHPITGQVRFHAGNDYPMNPGTPITVLKGGKVTRSEVNGSMTSGYGNLIEIQHPDGSKSVYAHLNQRNVSTGDTIKPGTVIGTVGSTGGSTGSHLHFEYDNPNGQTERSWQTINSKADQIFRFGNVKPSQTYKLALKNGKQGVIVDGKWKPQKWTKQESERYERVHGQQDQISSEPFSGNVSQKSVSIAKRLQRDLGLTDYQAAAIVGNLTQENTNLVPDLLEGSKKGLLPTAMRKGIGYGWAQWTYPSRQKELYDLAKNMGIDPDKQPLTDEINYAMLVREIPRYDSGGVFRKSKNIEDATKWFLFNYENPANKGTREQQERISDSKSILSKMKGKKGGGYISDIPKQTKDLNTSSLSSYPSYSESGTMMLIQPIIIEKPVPVSSNRGKTSFPVIGGVNSSSMTNFRG